MVVVLAFLYSAGRAAAHHSEAADLAGQVALDATNVNVALAEDRTTTGVTSPTLRGASAIDVHSMLLQAAKNADRLAVLERSPDTRALADAIESALVTFRAYAGSGREDDRTAFLADVVQEDAVADAVHERMVSLAERDWRNHDRVARVAFVLIPCVALLGGLLVGLSAWITERRLRQARHRAEAEQSELQSTAARLTRRNEQFQALYEVVGEVTETLSLKYVVQTTVREARKLIEADVTVLRVLREGSLIVEGSAGDAPNDAEDVELGRGLAGRAGKRGKSFRLSQSASAKACDEERMAEAESALVVPLIVGARVVGTLSCWSRLPDKFSLDDELAIEMMASQVATAVVAAGEQEETNHAAEHDPLTGLPNRRLLARDIRARLEADVSARRPITFAMIDVDHFKEFNDTAGHRAGDLALQQLAEVLQASIRSGDSIYRYGGEEFLVVMPGAVAASALALAERLRLAVESHRLTGDLSDQVEGLTVSVGVAWAETDMGVWDLVKLADAALYRAKREGRNCVISAVSATVQRAA
jgi:diguanylate cyclase (GGDEF)-like protein